LAGDVTQYVAARYAMPQASGSGSTFTSAAYLAEVFNVAKAVVIIPETLFEKDHCKLYRLLLEAKSGYNNRRLRVCVKDGKCNDVTIEDKLVHRLIMRGFDCYVVPHPGLASPLNVTDHGDYVEVRRGNARRYPDYGFNLVFDSVYRILAMYAEQVEGSGNSICIDVTHGTNLLVSATLLAASLIPIVYDVDVKVYAAPVMARPEGDVEVSVLELSDAVSAVKEVIAGALAWSKVDERLMNIGYYESMGSRLGRKYRDVYGDVRSVLASGVKLLWSLRSGQIPAAIDYVKMLRGKIETVKRELKKILSEELPLNDQPHQDVWKEHCGEPPWATVASACTVLMDKLLRELSGNSNLELMVKALNKLLSVGYPDKVVCVGRELITLVYAWKKGLQELKVGEDAWRSLEGELARERELASVFERVRSLRNKLMHGRLSREENVTVKRVERQDGSEDVELYSGSERLRLIERGEVERVAKELVNRLKTML